MMMNYYVYIHFQWGGMRQPYIESTTVLSDMQGRCSLQNSGTALK